VAHFPPGNDLMGMTLRAIEKGARQAPFLAIPQQTKPLASRSRKPESRNKWLPLSPTEQAAPRLPHKGTPLAAALAGASLLVAVRGSLQLRLRCLEPAAVTGKALPAAVSICQGPQGRLPSSYASRIEAAGDRAFFRDALRHLCRHGIPSHPTRPAEQPAPVSVMSDWPRHDLIVFPVRLPRSARAARWRCLFDGLLRPSTAGPPRVIASMHRRLEIAPSLVPAAASLPRTDLLGAGPAEHPQAAPTVLWWRQDRRRL